MVVLSVLFQRVKVPFSVEQAVEHLHARHFLKTLFTSCRPCVSQKRSRRKARVVSVPEWQTTTSSLLVWSNCGSNLMMRLFRFTCPLLHSSLIVLFLCFSATWIQTLLIPLQRASLSLALYINMTTQESTHLLRQTVSFTPTDSFIASIGHSWNCFQHSTNRPVTAWLL